MEKEIGGQNFRYCGPGLELSLTGSLSDYTHATQCTRCAPLKYLKYVGFPKKITTYANIFLINDRMTRTDSFG